MTLYRDPKTGLEAQVATKRGVLAERLARLSPMLRALAPPSTRTRLAAAPDAEAALPEDVAALAALDALLDDALAAADEVSAAEARLRRCPHDVAPFPRSKIPPPWLIEEPDLLDARRRFTAEIASLVPDVEVVRWGDTAYVARGTLRGSPLLVRVRFDVQTQTPSMISVEGSARTSVPEAMPLVTVRRERMVDSFAKLLGVRREHEVGDPAFDDSFWVSGDEGLAAAIPPVAVAELLALASMSPELAFGRGLAEVRWSTRLGSRTIVPSSALEVVLGIREAVEGG